MELALTNLETFATTLLELARQDSDFEGIANQPRFSRLLYPER